MSCIMTCWAAVVHLDERRAFCLILISEYFQRLMNGYSFNHLLQCVIMFHFSTPIKLFFSLPVLMHELYEFDGHKYRMILSIIITIHTKALLNPCFPD